MTAEGIISRRDYNPPVMGFIYVQYPSDSICTITNGPRIMQSDPGETTHIFYVPEVGTWTVSATDGDSSDTDVVTVEYGDHVNVALFYGAHAFTTPTAGKTYSTTTSNITPANLKAYACAISRNRNITNRTTDVYIDDDANEAYYKISVGSLIYSSMDEFTNSTKPAVVIGFNHDDLADPMHYGFLTATGKAGITIAQGNIEDEYVTSRWKTNEHYPVWYYYAGEGLIDSGKIRQVIEGYMDDLYWNRVSWNFYQYYAPVRKYTRVQSVTETYSIDYPPAGTLLESTDSLFTLSPSEMGYEATGHSNEGEKYMLFVNNGILPIGGNGMRVTYLRASGWWMHFGNNMSYADYLFGYNGMDNSNLFVAICFCV